MKRNLYGIEQEKSIYFRETRSGNWTLVRADGTKKTRRKGPVFEQELSEWEIAAWKRAILFAEEYDIWDRTAFGCTMTTMLMIPIECDRGFTCFLLIASCDAAEKKIYPYLPKSEVKKSREYVNRFYRNPELQKKWEGFLLHPVCFTVSLRERTLTPFPIEEIWDDDVDEERWFRPTGSLRDVWEFQKEFLRGLDG